MPILLILTGILSTQANNMCNVTKKVYMARHAAVEIAFSRSARCAARKPFTSGGAMFPQLPEHSQDPRKN
eukprot:3456053-Prymnesium_polylepis.1